MAQPSSHRCEVCGAVNQDNAVLCLSCNHLLLTFIPAVSAPLLPNTLFNDRYHIISKVGSGGYASVYKATDTRRGGRLVAVKEVSLLELEPRAVIEATGTFHREVSFLSQLTHAGLPRTYEYCRTPEYLYLVMEYIEGETLEEYQNRAYARHKYIPLSEVLTIGIQLCSVLDYLHTRQPPIVFRDLKPANIMRAFQGQLYLIDFGIARHYKPGQAKDTIALGSLGYAAPEQYGKAQTTPRADIYSLGAVLHQLLTAEDPSEAPFHFTPLRVNSYISLSRLGILIEQMVEMDARKRPASVAVIKQELQHIANVWKAAMMNFWQPGPQHTHSPETTMGTYQAGYRAVKSPVG
jgi:serine/threonine protein kinase